MNPALPPELKARIDRLLEGVARKNLAERAAAISQAYRSGRGSAATITDEASALAYSLSRLPATYAVAAAVFDAVREADPAFSPKTLCDAGAGPGTASWAALEAFGAISNVTMLDSNPAFLALAKTLATGAPRLEKTVYGLQDLGASAPPPADLVVASFVLAEMAEEALASSVLKLWSSTGEVLVLIEPGTPSGFARIRAARAALLKQDAHLLAPCTHDRDCPMSGGDWCHFSQRLPRSRDHLKVKSASVPFEDERYSYVAATRRPVERGNVARIVAPVEDGKAGIAMTLCAERGLHRVEVPKRRRELYALLRRARWGDTILSEE